MCILYFALFGEMLAQPAAFSVTLTERQRVINAAKQYLKEAPRTVSVRKGVELYEHNTDPRQFNNLGTDAGYAKTQMIRQLVNRKTRK